MDQTESFKDHILFTQNHGSANHICSQDKILCTANVSQKMKTVNYFNYLNCQNSNISRNS